MDIDWTSLGASKRIFRTMIFFLAIGLPHDSFAEQVILKQVYGDPSRCILPKNIFDTLRESSSKDMADEIRELHNQEFKLLNAKADGILDDETRIPRFLKDCAAKQLSGVYTNGYQYCLAILRRDMLRRYFLQLRQTQEFLDAPFDAFLVNLGQELELSRHEFNWCKRTMLSKPTMSDMEFGQVIIVPEPFLGFNQSVKFSSEDESTLLDLLKDARESEMQYLNSLPRIIALMERFLATVDDDGLTEAIATAFGKTARQIHHPGLLWTLGYLFEEFAEDSFFKRFLEKVKTDTTDETFDIYMPQNKGFRKEKVQLAKIIGKLLNNGYEEANPEDTDFFVEWTDANFSFNSGN